MMRMTLSAPCSTLIKNRLLSRGIAASYAVRFRLFIGFIPIVLSFGPRRRSPRISPGTENLRSSILRCFHRSSRRDQVQERRQSMGKAGRALRDM